LKQQSVGRHVPALLHIILIPSKPVFALLMLHASIEAANDNFIVFGLTQPGLKTMIYQTGVKHANHYTADTVKYYLNI